MSTVAGFLQVIGFVLIVIGLLEVARGTGLVNRNSPFVTYRLKIGGFLLIIGTLILVLGIIPVFLFLH